MIVGFHPSFEKAYRKRIAWNTKLAAKTKERIHLFEKNSRDPILRDHALAGKKSHVRAFSVTSDIRIVYIPLTEDSALFIDIGTHPQVY